MSDPTPAPDAKAELERLRELPRQPILCLDFDGVIHRYSRGWQDGELYDPPTVGFFDWVHDACKHFDVHVYSSRSKEWEGIMAMSRYIAEHAYKEGWTVTDSPRYERPLLRLLHARRADLIVLTFCHEKPAAFLTIDDRALTFRGQWIHFSPAEHLLKFRPWNQNGDAGHTG